MGKEHARRLKCPDRSRHYKEVATARQHETQQFIANLQERQGPQTERRGYNFRDCAPRGVVRGINDSGVHKKLLSLPMITGFVQTHREPAPPALRNAKRLIPALNLANMPPEPLNTGILGTRVPDPLVGVFRPKPGASGSVRPLYAERRAITKPLHWRGTNSGDIAIALNDDSIYNSMMKHIARPVSGWPKGTADKLINKTRTLGLVSASDIQACKLHNKIGFDGELGFEQLVRFLILAGRLDRNHIRNQVATTLRFYNLQLLAAHS